MSGAMRPSRVSFAFQLVNIDSGPPGSWPRSASRTGCADSGETRYWYHEMSQATLRTTSLLVPDSGPLEAFGSPSLFAIPAIVRRKSLSLNSSAASTIASSCYERRRRIGSSTTGSTLGFLDSKRPPSHCLRLRRSETMGDVGPPPLTQPDLPALPP